MFLEFSSPSHAQEAVKMTSGYKLDKQHTFQVNLFSDFERFKNIPDEWEEPEIKPYEDKVCTLKSKCERLVSSVLRRKDWLINWLL